MSEVPRTSAELLRHARRAASLSQTELARRAHVAQSVVSAYESGRRQPSLSTLGRLVAATGHRLVLELERDPEVRPGLPDTPLGRRLRQRRAALLKAANRHGASNLRVFGSVARAEDSSESDIDLLVDLAPDTGLFSLSILERELSEILGCPVDLAPSDSLRPQVKAEAEAQAIPL
jgi:predicted nucleotidyltransferase/DNA-binding XRE family transcriptional regulator